MKTVIVVQSRLSSTRMPGKILKQVLGRPLLEYQIERLRRVRNAHQVVIATTENPADRPIEDLCRGLGADCFRGSEQDVLWRFHDAAARHGAELCVRVNSDCPLIDPAIVDAVIAQYLEARPPYDYVANILAKSYPIGMHTEVFPFRLLEEAHRTARDPLEREHVTPYIYRRPDRFRLGSNVIARDLSHHRWTIDYPEDFELVRRIYEALYPANPGFGMDDVLGVLAAHPDWPGLNAHIEKQQTV